MDSITGAGIVAGLSGAMVNFITRFLMKTLGVAEHSLHYPGELVRMVNLTTRFPSVYAGVLTHLGLGILSGIIFAHYIHRTTVKNILIKGAFFTSSLWLLLLGVNGLFRVPRLIPITPLSAVLIYLNLVIFGFTKALVVRKLFHTQRRTLH